MGPIGSSASTVPRSNLYPDNTAWLAAAGTSHPALNLPFLAHTVVTWTLPLPTFTSPMVCLQHVLPSSVLGPSSLGSPPGLPFPSSHWTEHRAPLFPLDATACWESHCHYVLPYFLCWTKFHDSKAPIVPVSLPHPAARCVAQRVRVRATRKTLEPTSSGSAGGGNHYFLSQARPAVASVLEFTGQVI